MITMSNTKPNLSETEISKFEKSVGFNLPESYREFLLMYNGGKPTPKYFVIPEWEEPYSLINDFWRISPGEWDDLQEQVELFEGRFPQGFISIARDPGDNQVLLGLIDEYRGKVYFWDHENEGNSNSKNPEDYGNIYLLSNSFEGFINQLKDENEL